MEGGLEEQGRSKSNGLSGTACTQVHVHTPVRLDRKRVLAGGRISPKEAALSHLWLSWLQEDPKFFLLCTQLSCCGNSEALEVPTAGVSEHPSAASMTLSSGAGGRQQGSLGPLVSRQVEPSI